MKKLPINLQSFSELATGKYLYVDKTAYIHKLLTGDKTYFLARPRRFGKSLLVSTLEAIFQGRKELFTDLAISKTDYDWSIHPIIKLDFSIIPHETSQELRIGLCNELRFIASEFGITLPRLKDPSELLKFLIRTLSHKNSVVILIDEYDKPLLDHIDNTDVANKCQTVLKSFYETIKGLSPLCRFVFLTGVSKFTKTSVFSGLNNLNDISEKSEGAIIVGYTRSEIEQYFMPHINLVANQIGQSSAFLLELIRVWYDGYRFCTDTNQEKLYAPLSVMYYLQDKVLKNYWFVTGTPSYLVNLLKIRKYDLSWVLNLGKKESSGTIFGIFDVEKIPLEALLYQAGYLTLESYDHENNVATLIYPNKEVQDSMRSYLLSMELNIDEFEINPALKNIRLALSTGNIALMSKALQIILAHIPYNLHIQQERYYHTIIQLLVWLLGDEVQSEVSVATGRIDLVVRTPKLIYDFEFKYDKSAQQALDQILERRYYEKYQEQNKPVLLVGISFNYQNKYICVEYEERVIS